VKADDKQAWEDLLVPTKIYVRDMKALLPLPGLVGAAHITGGGLFGNIERVLPGHLQLKLDWNWAIPRIFGKIEKDGNVDRDEMIKVFNMGIGLALVVSASQADAFEAGARKAGVAVFRAGSLEAGTKRLG
jgi:phosphoribosylformylglycinamidine cyclo-ligase